MNTRARLVLVALLLSAAASPRLGLAQERLNVYQLQCLVPTTPGTHTRATAWGAIRTARRTQYFVVSCQDGASPSRWGSRLALSHPRPRRPSVNGSRTPVGARRHATTPDRGRYPYVVLYD